jgi:hypothetical protein
MLQGAESCATSLSDHEWTAIKPMLPNKPRGVPRVNDRRGLNGIFWILKLLKVVTRGSVAAMWKIESAA